MYQALPQKVPRSETSRIQQEEAILLSQTCGGGHACAPKTSKEELRSAILHCRFQEKLFCMSGFVCGLSHCFSLCLKVSLFATVGYSPTNPWDFLLGRNLRPLFRSLSEKKGSNGTLPLPFVPIDRIRFESASQSDNKQISAQRPLQEEEPACSKIRTADARFSSLDNLTNIPIGAILSK